MYIKDVIYVISKKVIVHRDNPTFKITIFYIKGKY